MRSRTKDARGTSSFEAFDDKELGRNIEIEDSGQDEAT